MSWKDRLQSFQNTLKNTLVTLKERAPLPSFSQEEKKLITAKAREYVEAHFSGVQVAPLVLPDGREKLPVDLDVGFWVVGKIRASMIVAEQLPLVEALPRAVSYSLADERFGKLEEKDIASLRIEVTFFGAPWRKISREERGMNVIDPECGYVGVLGGEDVAYYIPMVHNDIPLRSLSHLIESLLSYKAGLSSAQEKEAEVFIFPTLGWIESNRRNEVDVLRGPILSPPQAPDLGTLVENTSRWLLSQETSPGLFPLKQTLQKEKDPAIDWPRLAFTCFALNEGGTLLGKTDWLAAALRMEKAIEEKDWENTSVSPGYQSTIFLYASLAAQARGDRKKAHERFMRADTLYSFSERDPIGCLYGSRVLVVLENKDLDRAEKIFQKMFDEWKRAREKSQLAFYCELLPLAMNLAILTRSARYLEQAIEIGDWYVARQLPDGSFPIAPGRNFSYTRGTGKILEALSLLPDRYEASLTKTLNYLASMQYSKENMYHIPDTRKTDFLGGFRHDAFNRDAWIDAAGHVILGCARLLAHKKK